MQPTIEDLKDSFKIGYEEYRDSREEADEIWNLYHNRHFTPEQLQILEDRGQPPETFNVIKMFSRMLLGYYSTVVNTAIASPVNPRDTTTANLLNDAIQTVFRTNRFNTIEGDQIKLGGLISGLMCSYLDVKDTGKRDQFNRPINKVVANYVPDYEIILDPMSRKDDYSDARYLHRFKWLPEEAVKKMTTAKQFRELEEYYNWTDTPEADFEYTHRDRFSGEYRVHDNYLIVHSVLEDDQGRQWSCYWHDDTMIRKEQITFKEVRWPYRVERLYTSDKTEYYGIFREVRASQHAINQAMIKIQLMVNTEKVLVEDGAVENLAEFEAAYNRVSGIIPVLKRNGIQIEKLSNDIINQYTIIDKAVERIQRVLGINDSFLGLAFASDSGRKVKLQQNATIMSLRYITARIESYYELLANDIGKLIQQYYYANQVMRMTDDITGQRWIELNRPMMEFSGRTDPTTGEPIMQPILLPEVDPATQDFMQDDQGNIVFGPVSEQDTEIAYTEFEIVMESSSFNDEDEQGQLLLETVMNGQIGQMIMQANPSEFFRMAGLSIKSRKTKYSVELAEILSNISDQLGQNPAQNADIAAANRGVGSMGSSPQSETLKIPQANTERDF